MEVSSAMLTTIRVFSLWSHQVRSGVWSRDYCSWMRPTFEAAYLVTKESSIYPYVSDVRQISRVEICMFCSVKWILWCVLRGSTVCRGRGRLRAFELLIFGIRVTWSQPDACVVSLNLYLQISSINSMDCWILYRIAFTYILNAEPIGGGTQSGSDYSANSILTWLGKR
jgi:hypothetical protein